MTRPAPGLDPALVARFGADLAQTLGGSLPQGASLALAVSGGPDSMAMLALAAAAFPGQICAATVDHGLRAAAVDEAAMVARWCAAAEVPHRTLVLRDAIGPSRIQETARALRYDLLGRWVAQTGAVALATAHHVEDQAETVLMRAVRGSGPAGLAGIRSSRIASRAGQVAPPFAIVRPLLGWRRADLRAMVVAAHVPFVDDPSNADDQFERVRVRRLMAETPWLDPVGLARTAQHVGEAHAALEEIAEWLWSERLVPVGEGGVALRIADLPRAVQRVLVRKAILATRGFARITRPAFDDASNVEPFLTALQTGVSATQGGVMGSPNAGIWHFGTEPPRRSR
jgi:tRNA(Ile)-lysidine synthase